MILAYRALRHSQCWRYGFALYTATILNSHHPFFFGVHNGPLKIQEFLKLCENIQKISPATYSCLFQNTSILFFCRQCCPFCLSRGENPRRAVSRRRRMCKARCADVDLVKKSRACVACSVRTVCVMYACVRVHHQFEKRRSSWPF